MRRPRLSAISVGRRTALQFAVFQVLAVALCAALMIGALLATFGVPYSATLVLVHPPSPTVSLYFNPEERADYRPDRPSFSAAVWLAAIGLAHLFFAV